MASNDILVFPCDNKAENQKLQMTILKNKYKDLKEIKNSIACYEIKKDNYDILEKVVTAQFQQNSDLRKKLLETMPRFLAYGHSKDLFLGIGFNAKDPLSRVKTNWKGENKLGELLMDIRERFKTGELKEMESEMEIETKEEKNNISFTSSINEDCWLEICHKLERFTYFWRYESVFSQHYPIVFTVDDMKFNCAEQYYMFKKAEMFNDTHHMVKIMNSNNPGEQKSYGRKVFGFNRKEWNAVCREIVRKGNFAKFSQHEDLLQILLSTRGTTLVEASPKDDLWGINLEADNYSVLKREWWKGQNWLGEVLTKLRDEDFKNRTYSEDFFRSDSNGEKITAQDIQNYYGYTSIYRSSSPFSPNMITPFSVHQCYYISLQHYLMHQSAVISGNQLLADKILKSINHHQITKLAYDDTKFNEVEWNTNIKGLIIRGNYEKFRQNAQLMSQLLSTKNTILVYYDRDAQLGNGISADSTKDTTSPSSSWVGFNLLGYGLTFLRDQWLQHGSGYGGDADFECVFLNSLLNANFGAHFYNLKDVDSKFIHYNNKRWEYQYVNHEDENVLKFSNLAENEARNYHRSTDNFYNHQSTKSPQDDFNKKRSRHENNRYDTRKFNEDYRGGVNVRNQREQNDASNWFDKRDRNHHRQQQFQKNTKDYKQWSPGNKSMSQNDENRRWSDRNPNASKRRSKNEDDFKESDNNTKRDRYGNQQIFETPQNESNKHGETSKNTNIGFYSPDHDRSDYEVSFNADCSSEFPTFSSCSNNDSVNDNSNVNDLSSVNDNSNVDDSHNISDAGDVNSVNNISNIEVSRNFNDISTVSVDEGPSIIIVGDSVEGERSFKGDTSNEGFCPRTPDSDTCSNVPVDRNGDKNSKGDLNRDEKMVANTNVTKFIEKSADIVVNMVESNGREKKNVSEHMISNGSMLHLMTGNANFKIDGKPFKYIVSYLVYKYAVYLNFNDIADESTMDTTSILKMFKLLEKIQKKIKELREEKNLANGDKDILAKADQWDRENMDEVHLERAYKNLMDRNPKVKSELMKSGSKKLVHDKIRDMQVAESAIKVLTKLRTIYHSP